MDKALTYVDDIIATLRGPFVVLGHALCIKRANRSFYKSFHVTQEETTTTHYFDYEALPCSFWCANVRVRANQAQLPYGSGEKPTSLIGRQVASLLTVPRRQLDMRSGVV